MYRLKNVLVTDQGMKFYQFWVPWREATTYQISEAMFWNGRLAHVREWAERHNVEIC